MQTICIILGMCCILTHCGLDKIATIFPDNIFKCIFSNENEEISINISLKFVPQYPFNNILALVQIMAWRRPDDKPLSEPMMIILLTHIYIYGLNELIF